MLGTVNITSQLNKFYRQWKNKHNENVEKIENLSNITDCKILW
jgi:hypothetical protein